MSMEYDIAIIGSGPGGYVAAIKAAQMGHKVVCIENDSIGGVCLNWGCIPTKALIKNADMWHNIQEAGRLGFNLKGADFDYQKIQKRSRTVSKRLSKGVKFLFKKNKIESIIGTARLLDQNTIKIEDNQDIDKITANNIILATGAHPRTIPGTKIDGENILSSRSALEMKELPESMIIIGAGAIGVEFGYIFNSFGVDVEIIEMMDQILPLEDKEIVRTLQREFKKQKIKTFTSSKVEKIEEIDGRLRVAIEKNGDTEKLNAEKVLMAIGVEPNITGLGLEKLDIATEKGAIKVDINYQTSVENIYAIGDVIGAPYLAHVASEEGIRAVETISGEDTGRIDYKSIPTCTYCQPQVASVGLTEKQAKDKFDNIATGTFNFRGNGKSIATGEITGLVKVIFDANTDILIGGHIVGAEATELLPELTLAVSNRLSYQNLISSIHAHPTMSEAIMEAILDSKNNAIHQ